MIIYLSSLAAPFPFIRAPGFLSPALYCASMCYQLLVSPLMLLVALSLDGRGTLPPTGLWALLLIAMSLALLGMGLMACYIVPEKRATFYKVRTKRVLSAQRAASSSSHPPFPHPPPPVPCSTSRSRPTWTGTAGRLASSAPWAQDRTRREPTSLDTHGGPGPPTKSERGWRSGRGGSRRGRPGKASCGRCPTTHSPHSPQLCPLPTTLLTRHHSPLQVHR